MQFHNPFEGSRPLPQRAAQFHFLHRLFVSLIPARSRAVLDRLLFRTAPDVPVTFAHMFADASIAHTFWSSYLITFVFCFGGTFVGTTLSGTLIGNTPGIRFFLKDWPNILNYTVICPLYIGF